MEFPSRGGDRPGDGDDNAAARVKGKGEGRLANAIMEKRIELCRPSSSLIFWRFALTLFDGLRCLISQFTFVLTLESKHAGCFLRTGCAQTWGTRREMGPLQPATSCCNYHLPLMNLGI
ncbi:uncharacterized protein LOC110101579 isoform X2 [Dendrobium catenatum]|uniref:Uncharacterized protein n=1 Tax=Dendrobium catenatum TaxID=906689 RepID=A0A2I0W1H7_9ASPA|nr:uncharacterized protein LOC110101579 isoform X2 [Dendrobium catenatum]PKU69507.1 hypothetical protein MA16_Dca015379 [Dendrobium catenatum]